MLVYKRGVRAYKAQVVLKDFYKAYKLRTSNPVSYKVFASVIRKYFLKVSEAVIFEGFDFKLPFRLGNQRIRKKKIVLKLSRNGEVYKAGLGIDYAKTKQLWEKQYPGKTAEEIAAIPDKKLVYLLNEHTDGYMLKWYWDRLICNVPNHSAYTFKATRWNKEKLVKAVKENNKLKTLYYE